MYCTKAKFLVWSQPQVSHDDDDDITGHGRSLSHWEIMAQICWSCTRCADEIKRMLTYLKIAGLSQNTGQQEMQDLDNRHEAACLNMHMNTLTVWEQLIACQASFSQSPRSWWFRWNLPSPPRSFSSSADESLAHPTSPSFASSPSCLETKARN